MSSLSPPFLDDTAGVDGTFADIKKELIFDTPALRKSKTSNHPIEVFLRIRPQSVDGSTSSTCLKIKSDTVCVATPPSYSKWVSRGYEGEQFMFSTIFQKDSAQKEVFVKAVKPVLEEFFNGQNTLLLAYGVTNSGKTYTITGPPSQPGLLPRTIDVIFNSLRPHLSSDDIMIKSKAYNSLTFLTNKEYAIEREAKEELLKQALPPPPPPPPPVQCDITSSSILDQTSQANSTAPEVSDVTGLSVMTDETCSMMNSIMSEFEVQEDLTLPVDTKNDTVTFCVFISYAEIYKEFIYDLLGEKTLHERPCLRLAADASGNPYIKGLREVQVASAREALQLLRIGMSQRHIAATRLNYSSSRSHSIYTIKLVRLIKGVRKRKVAGVNRISVVDLAGSERSKKTGASGDRIKEAGSINQSLHTLGHCIEAMRYNTARQRYDQKLVPFRNSKLTQLLQTYFVGKEKGVREGRVVMCVNVSDDPSVFDETFHVLKFSALASKVIPVSKPVLPQIPEEPLPVIEYVHVTDDKELARLKEELAEMKKEHDTEVAQLKLHLWEQNYKIRQEVAQEYNEQIVEIEEKYNREIDEREEMMEDEIEKRLAVAQKSMKKLYSTKRKRARTDDSDDGDMHRELLSKITTLQAHCNDLEEELEMERSKNAATLRDVSITYQTNMARVHQQMMALSNETIGLRKQHEQEIFELEESMTKSQVEKEEMLNEQCLKLSQEVDEKNRLLEETLAKLSLNTSSGKETEDEMKKLRETLMEEISEKEELRKEMDTLKAGVEEKEQIIHELQEKLAMTENRVRETEEKLKSSSNRLNLELRKKEEALIKMRENLTQEMIEKDGILEGLRKKLAGTSRELEDANETFKKSSNSLRLELEEKEKTIDKLTESLRLAQEELSKKDASLENLRCVELSRKDAIIDELRDRLSSMEEDQSKKSINSSKALAELTNRLTTTQEEITRLTELKDKSIEEMKRNLKKVEDELSRKEELLNAALDEKEKLITKSKAASDRHLEEEQQLKVSQAALLASLNEKDSLLQETRSIFHRQLEEKEQSLNELRSAFACEQKKSSETGRLLADSEEAFTRIQKELEEKKHLLKESIATCIRNQNELEAREETIKELRTTLTKDSLLQETRSIFHRQLEEKEQSLNELRSAFACEQKKSSETGRLLADSEEAFTRIQKELEEKKHLLKESIAACSRNQNELEAREETIKELRTTLTYERKESREKLLELKTTLLEKDKLLNQVKAEKDKEIDHVKNLLAEQKVTLGPYSSTENLYDVPPDAISQDNDNRDTEPLYDSVHMSRSQSSPVLCEIENNETLKDTVDPNDTVRHLKLLERSSQLEDSFDDDFEKESTPIFNFNPLIHAQRKKQKPKKAEKPKKKKEKQKEKQKESTKGVTPAQPDASARRYNLRTRKVKTPSQDFVSDFDSTENTPVLEAAATPTPTTPVKIPFLNVFKGASKKKGSSAALDIVDTPPPRQTASKIKAGTYVKPTSKLK